MEQKNKEYQKLNTSKSQTKQEGREEENNMWLKSKYKEVNRHAGI